VRIADISRDFLLDQGLIGRADENCQSSCADFFSADGNISKTTTNLAKALLATKTNNYVTTVIQKMVGGIAAGDFTDHPEHLHFSKSG
jgi:hypothetical protein